MRYKNMWAVLKSTEWGVYNAKAYIRREKNISIQRPQVLYLEIKKMRTNDMQSKQIEDIIKNRMEINGRKKTQKE